MKVNWIEIGNIKSFKDSVKITLNKDHNFIVGPNGSGKTTALQALAISLLTLVPKAKSTTSGRGGDNTQRFDFEAQQYPIQLPANYLNKDGLRKISLEISFQDSYVDFLNEYKQYRVLFNDNIKVINDNFWSTENLIETLDDVISKLEGCKERVFKFEFEVGVTNLGIPSASREANEAIISALEFIERARTIYEFLLKKAIVTDPIERGFNLVYLGADRAVSFSGQVGLSKGGFNEMFNNSSRGQSAQLPQYVFSNSSFDYISQSLLKIVEQITNTKWQKGDLDAESKIPELNDIKEVLKTLLGYELRVSTPSTPFDNTVFTFFDGTVEVNFDQLSSGEKSLIYFIFTLANPDIKNSFIIIDEAEVHLHGNMQGKLLEMMFAKKELNNQHFVSTHSPEMVNTLTISSVLRFYKSNNQTSYVNFKTDAEIGTDYDIIRLVNSQNNEKVFFADKVILVEGIKDRLLIKAILSKVNETNQIIEVIDVGGKRNFKLYKKYLDEIKVPVYIFADLDHLFDIKKAELSSMLEQNEKKIDDILTDKGSSDRKALVARLEEYLAEDNKTKVEEILNYIRTRGTRLKDSLSATDLKTISDMVAELNADNIFFPSRAVLKDRAQFTGEIEDFLIHVDQGSSSSEAIQNLVKYLAEDGFLKDMFENADSDLMNELTNFLSIVIHGDNSKAAEIKDNCTK